MSPLSAIRPTWPDLSALEAAQNGNAKVSGGAIPTSELPSPATAAGGDSLTTQAPASSSFSNLLGHMVSEVNAKQIAANNALQGLESGQGVSLHQAMIAMEEATVSFQLMVEVRNKLLDSYQQLMRMQV